MKKIVIHYPFIAKYRVPIFKLLMNSQKFKFIIWAGKKNNDKYLLTDSEELNFNDIGFSIIKSSLFNKVLEWQPSAIKNIFKHDLDLYIVLANPNSISVWICVFIARIRKIPILMWSHGYLKDERGLKGFIRKLFYKLANGHLLYGNRAKRIMVEKGFDKKNLHVIYNSLDYQTQKYYREKLAYSDRIKLRLEYNFKEDTIVLIAIGRLMKKLKIEQIFEAIKRKSDKNKDIRLLIVGDGPEKFNLEQLVDSLNINENVVFNGSCHDEVKLSKLYNMSDYSVVMGKVGLSAMHSLAYGIPMITNDNVEEHFPEIEAIVDGKTGFYFKDNDIDSFVSKIKPIQYRGEYYKNCIKCIEKNYTPSRQKELILNAILKTLEKNEK